MPLDPELERAVREVVANKSQPSAVSQRLIAWLKQLSTGDVQAADNARHLNDVCSALKLEGREHED
ncbi:CxC ATPase DNA modification system associated small protein [Rhizomicrobium electricum]|uniref:Uncharacterized protein n=1 Tax=Rhizomicrobium electricum TaxID=480070 RepID=A0ABP3Q7N4_9PROT|nr:CxC ATPase DNA modification system associated small protein [Rhizomicrobium electricum]NIJ50368.1 gluconate kinase [Rhizomicrobium electricum]